MISTSKTLDIMDILRPDQLGTQIANTFQEWQTYRQKWLDEKRELRDYVFATDTRSTSNSSLPWKNSTTIPKLCQIRDNLHANYMAALFPNDDWLAWEGDDQDAVTKEKAQTIEAYVSNKVRASNLKTTVSELVFDLIDYGNMFGIVEYVNEQREDPETLEVIPGYVGPKLFRLSPLDVVFDPTAASFEVTPKIVRAIKTLGQLKKDYVSNPNDEVAAAAFKRAMKVRADLNTPQITDDLKDSAFQVDGFSSYRHYFNSGMVEVLTYYGDIYDTATDTLLENHEVTIIDRCFVISKRPIPTWLGRSHIFHHGWRKRPDNLYAMGPLDNLVGMQYRIDHLENLKADAFDMIAFPMMKIRGDVPEFDYVPGEKVYVGDEGDVTFINPDTTALAADNQIMMLEAKMEEMAGAPKQAMGFRTPGEKTAYEVSSLENAAGRIFQNKTLAIETEFLSKCLNAMLEVGRRNMTEPELIKAMPTDIDVAIFQTITKDDINASGKLRPVGASHFAKRNQLVQNLTQFMSSSIGQDPAVNVHISGKALAKAAETVLGLERFELFVENSRVFEQMETQQLVQSASQQLELQAATPGLEPDDESI